MPSHLVDTMTIPTLAMTLAVKQGTKQAKIWEHLSAHFQWIKLV